MKIKGFFLLLVSFLLLGCMKESDVPVEETTDMAFHVSDAGFISHEETKTTCVYTSTLETSGFKAVGTYGYPGSESLDFLNAQFTKVGTKWSSTVGWPIAEPAGGMHFYASNVDMAYSPSGVTVTADNATDVVCAYCPDPAYMRVNLLHFKHIFARLGKIFILAEDGYTITGVSVRLTPKTGGVFDFRTGMDYTDGTGWSSVVTGSETTVADALGENDVDLYLVPGEYTAKISWTATKNDVTEVYTDVQAKVLFRAGRISNFYLILAGVPTPLTSSYLQIHVDRSQVTHDVSGSAVEFNVTARKADISGFMPAAYRTMVKDGDDWRPLSDMLFNPDYSWLVSYPRNVDSPASIRTTYNTTVPAAPVRSHEEELRVGKVYAADGTTPVDNSTSANAVDLSMYDFINRRMESSRYTANCYVVSAPGWYKFPLVYGNGIENSATHSLAYNPTSIGLGHLDGFKNYKHNPSISDPWIENDWNVWLVSTNEIAGMHVGWQQYSHFDEGTSSVVTTSGAQGVIDHVSIISGPDGRYCLFHIDENNIRPGNILLTAKDAGGDSSDDEGETDALTMWSWHIWICDFSLEPVSVSNGSQTYDVLPANVGWVDGVKGLHRPRREVVLRFESIEDPTVFSEELTVVQEEGWERSTTGWGPYYQWGRKDPFVTGLFTYRANYDVGLRGSIRHPEMFNSERSTYLLTQYYYDWLTNNYDNMWDSNWNDYGVTSAALPTSKTVMDPSPRKFCVAPDLAWNGFVSYGSKGSYSGGYDFYTKSSRTETIFFPGCGYIGYDGVHVTGETRYWTLHAWASAQRRASYSLRFTSSAVETCYYNYNHRAGGQPIRSVRNN